MAFKLQACSNSVGQIASLATSVKDATNTTTSEDFLIGVDPLLLGAAWRTILGVRALADPDAFAKAQFADHAGTKTSKALVLRTGLLNLQVATLQVAASAAGMKTETRRNLHAAMALNNFSSAGLALYNQANNGLDNNEAMVRAGVTLALGCLAAAQAAKEHSEL